jgi:hypothetical protein
MSSSPNLTDVDARLSDLLDRAARVLSVGASPFTAEFYAGNRMTDDEIGLLMATVGFACSAFSCLDRNHQSIARSLSRMPGDVGPVLLRTSIRLAGRLSLDELAARRGDPQADGDGVAAEIAGAFAAAPDADAASRLAVDLHVEGDDT